MFTPNPGMSHLDYNRLLPAVYAPASAPISSPITPTQKQADPKKDTQSSKKDTQFSKKDIQSSKKDTQSSKKDIQSSKKETQSSKKDIQSSKKETQSSKLRITKHQKEILYGTLLGDASLSSENGGKTYRLRLVQGRNHTDYFHHLVSQFEHFGKTGPKINPANNTHYWNSLQSESFRFYGKTFYKPIDGKKFEKKVPPNVKKWLTPRVATYWFLDDGSAKYKKKSTAFRLCTDDFTLSDVKRLAEGLETNFDIKTSIYANRPNQYRIYCKAPSVSSFWDKVIPILQKEIQPTAPQILTKLPKKIYNQVIDIKQPDI